MSEAYQRVSLRFSADARYAAFLAERDGGGYVPEHWTVPAGGTARGRRLEPAGLKSFEPTDAEALPTVDGRLLLLRYGATHRIWLLDQSATVIDETTAAGRALRLVATPAADTLALAVGSDGPDSSTVYRVLADPLRLEPVATVPGRLGVTSFLDRGGRVIAGDLHGGGSARPVRVDLATGTLADLPRPDAARLHRLLMADADAGLLLVLSDAPGRPAFGWAPLHDPAAVAFPDGLNAIDGITMPLAIDPGGGRIALRAVRGARSAMVIYDLATDACTDVALPPGTVSPSAAWARDGLRVAYATTERPATPVVLRPPEFAGPARRPAAAPLEWFSTPDTRFEAVCYGDWRTADHVVVALHGGPESAWELHYDRAMNQLAAGGIAIVAPNQRGSTNYGTEHAAAIRGRWGGPDLDDIRHLARAIEAGRRPGAPRAALFGASYGAFLALLAAAYDPELWSSVAVVAPFLSGARLWPTATPPLRAMIDRLGGRETFTDELGPRDVYEVGGRITAPVLVIHGAYDEVVPVEHGRLVVARLTELGRDVEYVEVPHGGHGPLQHAGGVALAARLAEFLTRPAPAAVGAGG